LITIASDCATSFVEDWHDPKSETFSMAAALSPPYFRNVTAVSHDTKQSFWLLV
jgi:hypothetical protein